MTTVVLRASGYIWKCAECGRENYTGPAPAIVQCEQCNGEFEVKELHHRRSKSESDSGKEAGKTQQKLFMPLFESSSAMPAEDDIPF
jgi:DNA-directed RNA polymerase subunit RPC12/RpoP